MLTPADFRLRFPEFATAADPVIALAIADAAPFFDVWRWGAFYNIGVANFVAHNIAMSNYLATRTAGQIVGGTMLAQKKVGDVQVANDPGMLALIAKDPFNATPYGQKYLSLRRKIGSGGLAV